MQPGDPVLTHNDVSSYRAASVQQKTANRLGPLRGRPGFWANSGFSLIVRLDFSGNCRNKLYLELNLLRETIEFTIISSPVAAAARTISRSSASPTSNG